MSDFTKVDITKKTLTGVQWSAIEHFFNQLVTFVIGVILARLLSPHDFGLVGMLSVFLYVAQSLVDSGFSNALIRKKNRTHVDCSTVFCFNVVVGIIMVAIMYFLAPSIGSFFKTSELVDITRVTAIVLFINSLSVVQIALFTANIDFKTQAKGSVLSNFLGGLVGVFLAYAGHGVWALVWQSLTTASIKCVLFWCYSHWFPSLVFSYKSFVELFSFGSKLMISSIINSLYSQAASILIGRFYTPSDLAYYNRGSNFAHLPSSTFSSVIQRVTFPLLAQIQEDKSRLIDVYRKYIKLSSLIMFFVLLLLASLAKPIILTLLTEEWEPAVVYLQLFSLSVMTSHFAQINMNLLQVEGRSELCLRIEIVKKVIALGLMLLAVPHGVLIMCLSVVLYSPISLYLNTYYTGKLYKMGIKEQIGDCLPYLVKSFIACIPSFILTFTSIPNLLVLVIGTIVSCVLYYFFLRKDQLFITYILESLKKIKK